MKRHLFLLVLLLFFACESADQELNCPQIEISAIEGFEELLAQGETVVIETTEGTDTSKRFYIRNGGAALLKIGVIRIDSGAFVTQASSVRISEGEQAFFDVQFDELVSGDYLFEVVVPSNDWDEPLFSFFIRLRVSPKPVPDIAVFKGNEFIPSPSGICVLDSVEEGSSYPVSFIIRNEGQEVLFIDKIESSSESFVLTNFPSTSLEPSVSVSFEVIFQPTEAGEYSTLISIANSDPDSNEAPYLFEIKAVATPRPEPEIEVLYLQENRQLNSLSDPRDVIDGGTITESFRKEFDFEIENTGTANLLIENISINNPLFAISSVRSRVLEPNSSFRFKVVFLANTTDTQSAIVSIKNNDTDENPFEFEIRMNVEPPAFEIRYLNVRTPDGINTIPSSTGANRTLFVKNFDIIDPQNLVGRDAFLRVQVITSNGFSDSYTARVNGTDGRRIIFDNQFEEMTFRQSIRFAQASYIDFLVYLQLPTGQKSNLETYRITKPPQAN